jgi:hypothetical protein
LGPLCLCACAWLRPGGTLCKVQFVRAIDAFARLISSPAFPVGNGVEA